MAARAANSRSGLPAPCASVCLDRSCCVCRGCVCRGVVLSCCRVSRLRVSCAVVCRGVVVCVTRVNPHAGAGRGLSPLSHSSSAVHVWSCGVCVREEGVGIVGRVRDSAWSTRTHSHTLPLPFPFHFWTPHTQPPPPCSHLCAQFVPPVHLAPLVCAVLCVRHAVASCCCVMLLRHDVASCCCFLLLLPVVASCCCFLLLLPVVAWGCSLRTAAPGAPSRTCGCSASPVALRP